jgi:acyl-CoA thioesterase II
VGGYRAGMRSDEEFLGLQAGDAEGRFTFTVRNDLARLDGQLYGGTAIAVSITASELVSQRRALWMTTQFVSTAPAQTEISVHAEVLAPGRRTNQVRVTGTDATGAVMFASLGAAGHHRDDGLAGTFENPPTFDAPAHSEPRSGPFEAMARNAGVATDLPQVPADRGFTTVIEFREPAVHDHPDPGPGRLCLWVRRRDGAAVSPAVVAFMADMVPLSVAHACGVMAGGISLDNTIRIGAFEPTEWVLLDLRPHLAVGDYGHGAAHIWSEQGHLLATASQSASMVRFDPADLPWRRAE